MQIQIIQNNNYNSTTFNAHIKGINFSNKYLLSDILKQAPFDKCNEVFSVSDTYHILNGYTGDYEQKAFVALRKLFHNAKGVSRRKQPEVRGIPIATPDSVRERDLAIAESIIKYLSENYKDIPKETFDNVCRRLGLRLIDEIPSTESRILEYSENHTCDDFLRFYRKPWER